MTPSRDDTRRPRGPGVVYAALSTALAVMVGTIALRATQTPPPTIAEFAPQAQALIEDAPDEQTSQFGSRDGGLGGTTDPTPPPVGADGQFIDAPRVRRCVGDPPRQIEDPQSPPCVPYWDGDNGGSTSKGVDRNEIRIIAARAEDSFQTVRPEVITALEGFFNSRFEFYGRKLRLIPERYGATNDVVEAQAQAREADQVHKPFASTHFMFGVGAGPYHDELARSKIVSVRGPDGNVEHRYLAAQRPYTWSYIMSVDRMLVNIGQWVCGRLAGRDADHAGSGVQGDDRVFGIITATYTPEDLVVEPEPLERELGDCGVTSKVTLVNPFAGSGELDAEGWRNAMLQMQTNDVTTILCVCTWWDAYGVRGEADRQAYFPEWLVSSYGFNDTSMSANYARAFFANSQQRTTFGLTFQPRQVRFSNEPVVWAINEGGGPNVEAEQGGFDHWTNRDFYHSLLLIASGIQMAGPNLTPEAFEDALHTTHFPNPDHPIMAGAVGFAGRSYSMTIDGAEWWWSETEPNPYGEGQGTVCYIDGGARHRAGSWPSGTAPFFEPPCDSLI